MSSTGTPPIRHVFTRPGYDGPFPVYTPYKGSYDSKLRISPKGSKPVLRLTPELALKFGSKVRVNEAEALLLIEREAPSVPVPRVHACYVVGPYVDRDESFFGPQYDTFIIMSLVEGVELEQAWPDLDTEQKAAIASQMSAYTKALRSIAAPATSSLCAADGGPLTDIIFDNYENKGPFDSIQDFNAALVEIQHKSSPREHLRSIIGGALAQISHHDPVFTHADLQARNIMVSSGTVSGIIDWEMSGWYPSYWEFSRCFRVRHFPDDWPDFVRQMIEPHDLEYILLRTINTHVW